MLLTYLGYDQRADMEREMWVQGKERSLAGLIDEFNDSSSAPWGVNGTGSHRVEWVWNQHKVYWAICSSARLFARTAHSFACFTLLALHCLHCLRAPLQSFASMLVFLLTPKLIKKMSIVWRRQFHTISTHCASMALEFRLAHANRLIRISVYELISDLLSAALIENEEERLDSMLFLHAGRKRIEKELTLQCSPRLTFVMNNAYMLVLYNEE